MAGGGVDRKVAQVEAENVSLRAELGTAREVIAGLEARVAEQDVRIAEQDVRIAELVARLEQNPRNSSKPPSSEGLGKPPPVRRVSGRRPGKQPGADGRYLAQVDDPDEVVVHVPSACAGCGEALDDAEVVGEVARQVFDLPEPRVEVVEHRAQRRRCGCGQTTAAEFPVEATAPACYGSRVRAAIVYLAVYQHLPVDRLASLMGDLLGVAVATGTVWAVLAQAPGKVGTAVEVIRRQLVAAPVVCFDETGARIDGTLHWIHSAGTQDLTLVAVHRRRGVVAMDAAGVLPAFAGVAVHDCWPPYWRYEAITHALCNAHLLRELTAALEAGQGWAGQMSDLLVEAKQLVEVAVDAGADRLDAVTLGDIDRRYRDVIAAGHAANPTPPRTGRRGRTAKSKAANLLGRLDDHQEAVLRFTTDLSVPFDNNLAERDVRMIKLQQKVSGCWRTLAGAEAFCAVRSYLATARKHNVNLLDVLQQAFVGDPWLPPARAGPPQALPAAA
ncbi:MAG: IS66 family transposase [Nitriliruptoraceae bacterium]